MNRIFQALLLCHCILFTTAAAQDKEKFPKPELSKEPSTYCRYIHERRNDFVWKLAGEITNEEAWEDYLN